MSLEDIVELTIVVQSTTLTRPSFGIPLCLVSKVPAGWGTAPVRTFTKLSELVDAGFATTDTAYVMASRLKAQSPSIKTFKIGKRATAPSQSIQIKCLSATEGDIYTIDVGVDGGTKSSLTYTVLAAATTTTVATAIELLVEAVTGVASSSATDTITATPVTSGTLVNVANWSSNIAITDGTADPGIATDLATCLTADDAWYGLVIDSNSKAEILAAAAWVESNKKLFGYSTSDAAVLDPGTTTTNVFYQAKAAAYTRSFGLYSGKELLSHSGAAWVGKGLSFDPGRITWAHKTLAGITVDRLTGAARGAIEAANGNHYEAVSGKNVTRYGKVASGEFIDVTHFVDWLDAEMKLQVFAAISGLPKLPYTNAGLAVLEATVRAVLQAGVRAQGLVNDENLTVTMPKLEDIDSVTRSERLVPDIEFTARLAGAVHKTSIFGTLTK